MTIPNTPDGFECTWEELSQAMLLQIRDHVTWVEDLDVIDLTDEQVAELGRRDIADLVRRIRNIRFNTQPFGVNS